MKKFLADPDLFGNEAGEDENIHVLNSYFVEKDSFEPFFSSDYPFKIVKSKKGIGKSALLKQGLNKALSSSPYVMALYLKGSDLIALQEVASSTPHDLIFGWQQRICSRINMEIGKNLNIALSDDAIRLVESSEIAGFKNRNIVGVLLNRLKLKFGSADIELKNIVDGDAQSVLQRYSERKGVKTWLFVDDIDATFLNREDIKLLTSTFFSACRNLVNDVDGLFIRASVRTDVWHVLAQYDESLDKCQQYLIELSWSTRETGEILKKKIKSYFTRKYPTEKRYSNWDTAKDANLIYREVFRTPMSWSNGKVPPDKPIHILSAGRPRWASQLCKLAGQHAVSSKRNLIGIQDISNVLKIYGKSRLDDLYREHSHQTTRLNDIIESFAGGAKRYSTEALLKHIGAKIIKRFGLIEIDGLKQKGDGLYIAHLLFRMGFIQGRDEKGKTGLEFVGFNDRPNLLISTTNPDDGLQWEIHPSYRSVLRIA